MKIFNNLPENFPFLKKLFNKGGFPFSFPTVCVMDYFRNGRIGGIPHTKESILRKTKIPHYEMWKEITLSMPNGIELLTKQKEFHIK